MELFFSRVLYLMANAVVDDGGGMLHSSVHWPKVGSINGLAKVVELYVSKSLKPSDVYLIYDRYFEKSSKSDT